MKKITTEIITKRNFYICDICQHEYWSESDALSCEKKHQCPHSIIEYIVQDYSIDNNCDVIIERQCTDCYKMFESKSLKNIGSLDEKLIKLIFEMLPEED